MVLLCIVHVTYNVSLIIIIIIILLSFMCNNKMYNKNRPIWIIFMLKKLLSLLNICTWNNHSQTTKL